VTRRRFGENQFGRRLRRAITLDARHRLARITAFSWCLVLCGCGLPVDPNSTLAPVRGGTIRAGLSHNPPWVRTATAEASGIEPDLVREFAATIDARVDWVRGSESQLFAALKAGELDVVLGGLTDDSPWASELAATLPYVSTRLVIATAQGGDAPELRDLQINIRKADAAAAYLRSKGARLQLVETMRSDPGSAAAIEDWRAAPFGLRATNKVLRSEKHICVARRAKMAGCSRWIGFSPTVTRM
jgi:polar amino acid transport system substrate-binding protein